MSITIINTVNYIYIIILTLINHIYLHHWHAKLNVVTQSQHSIPYQPHGIDAFYMKWEDSVWNAMECFFLRVYGVVLSCKYIMLVIRRAACCNVHLAVHYACVKCVKCERQLNVASYY